MTETVRKLQIFHWSYLNRFLTHSEVFHSVPLCYVVKILKADLYDVTLKSSINVSQYHAIGH